MSEKMRSFAPKFESSTAPDILGFEEMSEYDSELSKIVAELNRAAPSQKSAAARLPQSTASLDQLLHAAAGRGASDVLLIAGAPVMLRLNGVLAAGGGGALEPEDIRSLVLPLLEPWQL